MAGLLLLTLGCVQATPDDTDEVVRPTPRTDAPGATSTPQALRVHLGPRVDCHDPAARDGTWWDEVLIDDPAVEDLRLVASGFALADLTGDGRVDLLTPGEGAAQLWVQTADARWVDEAPVRLDGVDLQGAIGASAADHDGDGDLDVIVFRAGIDVVLLRNDDGFFTDVTAESGLTTGDSHVMAAAWGDYDRDGDLDLALGGYRADDRSWLYANDGDGTFTDTSHLLPEAIHAGWAFMSAWIDVDGDAWPELVIPNDFGRVYPSVILHNNKGSSFRVAQETLYHPQHAGMGVTAVDLNGDAFPDWFESTFKAVTLMESVPGPEPMGVQYIETHRSRGVMANPQTTRREFGWGVDAGDLDNDADIDLVATFGTWDTHKERWPESDVVWLRRGDGDFDQLTADDWHDFASRGMLVADVNDDGWLDVVKRVLDAPSRVLIARCGDASWTKVRLEQPGLNRHAVGAVIEIESEGAMHRRWLHAGSASMFSSGPPEVHAGLAGATRVDRVRVLWPDGLVTLHEDLPARRVLTIIRPPSEI